MHLLNPIMVDGHPTKKNTPGRLRHFEPETPKQMQLKQRFAKIMQLLGMSANR